jgi:hypothetical protein
MLEKISWGDYFTAIICVAFLYYVAVILLYYRRELQSFLQRNATKPGTGQTDNNTAGTVKDQAFSGLEDNTITDLRGILEKAGKGASKDELLERLNPMPWIYVASISLAMSWNPLGLSYPSKTCQTKFILKPFIKKIMKKICVKAFGLAITTIALLYACKRSDGM